MDAAASLRRYLDAADQAVFEDRIRDAVTTLERCLLEHPDANVARELLEALRAAPDEPPEEERKPATAGERSSCIILTNCIGWVIRDLFHRYPGFTDHFDVHFVENFRRQPISDELLARAGIFVYQPLDAAWGWGELATDSLLRRLPEGCRAVSLPSVEFFAPWPFHARDRRNRPTPEFPFGKYPYGDSFVLELLAEGRGKDEIVDRYLACDVPAVVELDRLYESEIARMRHSERATDIRIADRVHDTIRDVRLFNSVNHPRNPLSVAIVDQLFEALGLDPPPHPFDETLPEFLAEQEIPIHPRVAEHLGLRWADSETRYFYRGVPRTFREYVEDYVEFR